jgi:putative NIF3 family GTP cyclohydrolase 1 type 2
VPAPHLTRRTFTLTAAALATGGIPGRAAGTATANDLIGTLKSASGVTLPEGATDGFLAGVPTNAVKGVAVTNMATLDVLRQAVKANLNFVITYENLYYGQPDPLAAAGRAGRGGGGGRGAPALGPDDPVYEGKKKFIDDNGLVVYRFRDQWTARHDNPLATGLAAALGWSKYQTTGDPTSYSIPAVKFETLVADVRKRMSTRGGIRVLGDRTASIQKVALLPGLHPIATGLKVLPSADLIVAGETREWEITEYVQDAATAGLHKGLIMLGKIYSEEPGMRTCADWIKATVKDVPVQSIGTGDPYWRPAK